MLAIAHHKPRIASACARAALPLCSDMEDTHTKKREDGKKYGRGLHRKAKNYSHAQCGLWQAALAFQFKAGC